MEDNIEILQKLVDVIQEKRASNIKVLEAGCGSRMNIHFGEKAHITGIDISEKQLLRNQDIDEKILGDIQSYDFSASSFDIIICWNVLEHVQDPTAALSKFINAIKQGGIIILGLPNVSSLKGLLTKYSPHIFHVWIYKYLYGFVNAGKDDNAPFKTVLRYSIAPNAIKRFAQNHGLRIIHFATFDSDYNNRKLVPFFIIKRIVKFLSMGRLGDSDFIIVLEKT